MQNLNYMKNSLSNPGYFKIAELKTLSIAIFLFSALFFSNKTWGQTCNSNDPSTAGVTPTLETFPGGDPICNSDVAFRFGESFPNNSYTSTDGSITITVTSTSCGPVFSFSTNGATVYQIFVKGSTTQNIYNYPGGTTSDGNLHSPINSSGKYSGLSHIDFCYTYCEPKIKCPPASECLNTTSEINAWYASAMIMENCGKDLYIDANPAPDDLVQCVPNTVTFNLVSTSDGSVVASCEAVITIDLQAPERGGNRRGAIRAVGLARSIGQEPPVGATIAGRLGIDPAVPARIRGGYTD